MVDTVFHLLDYREGKISAIELSAFLRRRDHKAKHWVDSSTFFSIAPDVVIDTFPFAKYFFAIRPCEDWVSSMFERFTILFNMRQIGRFVNDLQFLDRFTAYFARDMTEANMTNTNRLNAVKARIVEQLADSWRENTQRSLEVLAKLPADRRLVIWIDDFDKSINTIARFSGAPTSLMNLRQTHGNGDQNAAWTKQFIGVKLLKETTAPQQAAFNRWLANYPQLVTARH